MSVPTDATSVAYTASYYNGDIDHPGVPHIEIGVEYKTPLPDAGTHGPLRELLDTALAAAFLAIRDAVETTYPGTPGGVRRSYSGPVAGDAFPPAS
ncbi:hypothetical protein AB0I98_16695 [Streptomyces sp. NPDC050211]|uniref:hypothetical protein n=1 Tax=Streptomyces sp. NPDC050211 TaxID=3154932 RepID=UPI00342F8279